MSTTVQAQKSMSDYLNPTLNNRPRPAMLSKKQIPPVDKTHMINCTTTNRTNFNGYKNSPNHSKEMNITYPHTTSDIIPMNTTQDANDIIEIGGDISSCTILTFGNTYRVTEDINVISNGLLAVEPNVTIRYAENTGIKAADGGRLYLQGTPENPILHLPNSDTPYMGFWKGILIEDSASSSCKITYNIIEGAQIGIWTHNQELEHPIENNIIRYCLYGIVEHGIKHTPIINNMPFYNRYSGIEVFLASISGEENKFSYVHIEGNTSHYFQDCGIIVHGVTQEINAGTVHIVNNILSYNYLFNLALVDGYMLGIVENNGYYIHPNIPSSQNKNWDFDEDSPVVDTEFPFVYPPPSEFGVCYLRPESPFIDAGNSVYSKQQLGKSTSEDRSFDEHEPDIGYHYSTFDLSNAGTGTALTADLNTDKSVDILDLIILVENWNQENDPNSMPNIADINDDGIVNLGDFFIIASEFNLEENENPNIQINTTGDPNSGYMEIKPSNVPLTTDEINLFLNGEFIGQIESSDYSSVDFTSYGNSDFDLKLISLDSNNNVTLSENVSIEVNGNLNYVDDSGIEKDKDVSLSMMHSGYDLQVSVTDIDDIVIWTQVYSGNINDKIPAAIFSENSYYELHLQEIAPAAPASAKFMIMAVPDDFKDWHKQVTKKFNKTNVDPNAIVLISCPDVKITKINYKVVKEWIRLCEQFHWGHIDLYHKNATYSNIGWCLARHKDIRKWINIGHGTAKVNGVPRTLLKLYDCRIVSFKRSDFNDPNHPVPPDYQDLGKWETKAKSAAAWKIYIGDIDFVYAHSCYSALYSDFAWQIGIRWNSQVWCGWKKDIFITDVLMYFGEFSEAVAKNLRLSKTIYKAYQDAIKFTPPGPLGKGPSSTYGFQQYYANINEIKITD